MSDERAATSRVRRDILWIVLFLIIFVNGFESGGYQASLYSVGQDYDLSVTSMGLFAGKKTATATGMITAATGIGGFAFTALTGFMADQWGMQMAMAALAAFFIISLVAALVAIRTQRSLTVKEEL